MQKENLDKQEVNEMFLFADWCIRETLFVKGNKYYFVSPKAYATAKPYIMQELYDKFELTKEKPALSKGDVSEMLPSSGFVILARKNSSKLRDRKIIWKN